MLLVPLLCQWGACCALVVDRLSEHAKRCDNAANTKMSGWDKVWSAYSSLSHMLDSFFAASPMMSWQRPRQVISNIGQTFHV